MSCVEPAWPAVASGASTDAHPPRSGWLRAPKVASHLQAADLGLVINDADPYSVAVGTYYAQARGLVAAQVLHVSIPVRGRLTRREFEALRDRISSGFGPNIQAFALAWRLPFAVECNGITGALALGFDARLCNASCNPSRPSPYFNAPSTRPWTDLHLRPSMLLAAGDVAAAEHMIDRGVAADHRLGLRGAPPVQARFVPTQDAARNVRAPLFPPAGLLKPFGVDVVVDTQVVPPGKESVVILLTGSVHVDHIDAVPWAPGALADHLTSFGGIFDGGHDQMPATAWIDAGVTASYGTASEPCSHPQKFPHPQVLLLHYLQGATAIEAYWKSVAWPLQGVFIGEPLASPFSAAPVLSAAPAPP